MANILGGAIAGAAIVVCGGAYALLLAYGRKFPSRRAARGADIAFVLLALAAIGLVASLRLEGAWILLVGALLVGYRLAPAAMWRLCIGTHRVRRIPPREAP